MKILAISDTHGKIDKALKVCDLVPDADLLVHLGDYKSDGDEIGKAASIDTVAVKGNCDGSRSDEDYKIIKTPGGNILLTHGHMQNVKFSLQNLLYFTREHNCKATIFGHTHVPTIEEVNGTYLINPGSMTLPANNGPGSYAIINSTEAGISAGIVFCNTVTDSGGGKPKVTGGYLRNILNNSDRF
ncbi:MAG: metallophosphoesterase [Eubacteriales bacterium]|nr:metallophosphoesterase [Eubacteriales bacterium]MDD4566252.1 metallophosphoesterase [Eubacteriales bacterium]